MKYKRANKISTLLETVIKMIFLCSASPPISPSALSQSETKGNWNCFHLKLQKKLFIRLLWYIRVEKNRFHFVGLINWFYVLDKKTLNDGITLLVSKMSLFSFTYLYMYGKSFTFIHIIFTIQSNTVILTVKRMPIWIC